MKKNIIFILLLSFFVSCSEEIKEIDEFYENGLPKTVSYYLKNNNDSNKILEESYYPSGLKKEHISFRNGKKNGPFYLWNSEGRIVQNGFYLNGALDGKVFTYKKNNELIIRTFLKGKILKEQGYFSNKKIKYESNFKDDIQTGEFKSWFNNGQLEIIMTDPWNGRVIEFYSNGKKKSEGKLKDGKRFGEWNFGDSLGNKLPAVNY